MTFQNTPQDDGVLVWSLACNCLLYEEDPGPSSINIGSRTEPKMVGSSQAWRELYARLLTEQVQADVARIDAASADCRNELAATHRPEHWQQIFEARQREGDPTAGEVLTERGQREIREVWECAIDLCERAANMVRTAGAADSNADRQRLLAGLKHQNTVDVLGFIPGIAEDSADDLIHRLEELS